MILIDANMLMAQVQFKSDLIRQLKIIDKEIVVLMPVLVELEKLAIGHSNDAQAARVAIEIVAKEKLRIMEVELKSADKALVEYASLAQRDGKVAVATNDKELMTKLKEHKIPIYRLRQNKIIEKE